MIRNSILCLCLLAKEKQKAQNLPIAFCSQVRYTQFTGGVYQKNIQYTLASHAVERLRPSDDAIDLMQKMSEGKISADDAVNQLLKKYGISQGKRHG